MSASRTSSVLSDPRVRRAFQILKDREPEIEADQIRLTLVAAPPFDEGERSRHFLEAVRSSGLVPSHDSLGNVIVPYGEPGPDPIIIGAHLDTVFPRDVKLELRRAGRVLHLPGISDNGAGLVALLWVLRAAREAGLKFRRPVWGVANVGEHHEAFQLVIAVLTPAMHGKGQIDLGGEDAIDESNCAITGRFRQIGTPNYCGRRPAEQTDA